MEARRCAFAWLLALNLSVMECMPFFILSAIKGATIFALSPLAHAYEMLIIGRMMIGFALGMICIITPIYTSEVAPVALRGAMGTIPVVMSVLGMVVGTIFGLPFTLGSGTDWAILVALQIIPVAVMCAVLLFCSESPTYLYIVQQKKEEAKKALIWLRRTVDVEEELAGLEAQLKDTKYRHQLTMLDILKKPLLRRALLIAAVAIFAQHGAGKKIARITVPIPVSKKLSHHPL